MPQNERLGLIDLGSNSSRLAIYDIVASGAYRPVFEMKQHIRLAHNMGLDGTIEPAGISRAVACTKLFMRTGQLYGVTHWTAVATAAVRQAQNQSDVLTALEAATSLSFRVLSGDEEGRYGYLGVVNTLDIDDALFFDVGGASSELMLVKNRQLQHVVSIPYGGLNLREMFSHLSEPAAGIAARDFIQSQFEQIEWLSSADHLPLVGLGGTARALAKLHAYKEKYDIERLHGYVLKGTFASEQFDLLRQLSVSKRKKTKGISKSRAEILVAGLAIVSALSEFTQSESILISRNGLREGIFFETLLKQSASPVLPSVLEHSVTNFQKVFDVDLSVATVVTNATLKLFDALRDVHGLSDKDRKLLWVTANIESCGCYINTEKWTKHSAYLVLSSYLYGLTYPELTDIACLLSGKGSERLKQMMTLIRLAKLLTLQLGLDVEDIRVRSGSQSVDIHELDDLEEVLDASADSEVIDDFAKLFNYPVRFIAQHKI